MHTNAELIFGRPLTVVSRSRAEARVNWLRFLTLFVSAVWKQTTQKSSYPKKYNGMVVVTDSNTILFMGGNNAWSDVLNGTARIINSYKTVLVD